MPLPHFRVYLNPTELATFAISVRTLHGGTVTLQVSPLDTVQDVRQYLFETPETSDLTSYTLMLNGKPINDYAELSEVDGLKPDCTLVMAPGAFLFLVSAMLGSTQCI